MRELTYYVAVSVDGCIAGPGGEFDRFLGHEAPEGAEDVEFTDRDPVEVVREIKAEDGKGIWLCGGGVLATALRDEIDRFALKRNPVLFGGGIPLFSPGDYAPASFVPTAVTPFESGVVLEEYVRS